MNAQQAKHRPDIIAAALRAAARVADLRGHSYDAEPVGVDFRAHTLTGFVTFRAWAGPGAVAGEYLRRVYFEVADGVVNAAVIG